MSKQSNSGSPDPNPGPRRNAGGRRQGSRNTFNITSSTIGTLSVGNRGTTVLNQNHQTFNEGSKNVDFDIKGGNFNQANLGKEATYDNKQSNIISKGTSQNGTADGAEARPTLNRSIDHDLESDMIAEKELIEILKLNVSVADIKKLLEKKFTIKEILEAIKTQRNDAAVQRMIASMITSRQ